MSRQELADAAQYRPIEVVLELGKTAVVIFFNTAASIVPMVQRKLGDEIECLWV